MPRTTLKITDGQRRALYEQVRNHLAAFGDLWIALETDREYANVERLAVEFGEDSGCWRTSAGIPMTAASPSS
jgi:hypothetical protein